MKRVRLLLIVLLVPSLAGCAWLDDAWSNATRPDIAVQRSPLAEGQWNREARFVVAVQEPEPHEVRIVATSSDGMRLEEVGVSSFDEPVELVLSEGTWTVEYFVAGHSWETFEDVRIDSTPPTIDGLERVGEAMDGTYTLGQDAVVEAGAQLRVERDGQTIAEALPVTIEVPDGITTLQVIATDAAANQNIITVQVRAGDAVVLPQGQWDFGIVARYSNEARIWDLGDLTAYATPAQARDAVGGAWLGSGFGITPDDDVVQTVAGDVVAPEMTTAEAAWALYEWLFDNLEYDDARLVSTTLMLPRQVIQDSEDPDAEADQDQDAGGDGLADDGDGNGVRGGVCRDLAGTYVSLLRAAGIPARLVSGYLAGTVDGFHAWVEVYVGDVPGNPSPWMPVDVSPVDGRWEDAAQEGSSLRLGPVQAMTSFGVSLPEYLALRVVPEASEVAGWSTALSTQYTFPSSSGAPDIQFEKQILPGSTTSQSGKLCFDPDTRVRSIQTSGSCSQNFFDFTVFTERTIDYGIDVVQAGPGTEVEASLAYPFAESVAPDSVEWLVYGQSYDVDVAGGVVSASFDA